MCRDHLRSNFGHFRDHLELQDHLRSWDHLRCRTGPDLHTWLKNFERCCTIAEKKDDLVQGQLLMLSVEGRALAVSEQVEEEKGSQLKYSDLRKSPAYHGV